MLLDSSNFCYAKETQREHDNGHESLKCTPEKATAELKKESSRTKEFRKKFLTKKSKEKWTREFLILKERMQSLMS